MKNRGSYRPFLLLLAALSAACTALAQGVTAKPPFHLTGVVLSEETGAPVPRCHLTIRPEGASSDHHRRTSQASDSRTAVTDLQGRFAFDLPAEGSWQLNASASGFRTQLYNEHEGFSSAVVIHPNLPVPSLIFHMEPDSTISGFVRDEAAEPVRNATITLQPASGPPVLGGRRQRATTDDRGHYEIAGIGPGVYKLSVQATPWYANGAARFGGGNAPSNAADPAFDVVYPVTWYPGVLDVDLAGEITVQGGQSHRADFSLLPIPSAHLRVPLPSGASSSPAPTVERVESRGASGRPTQVLSVGSQLDFGSLAPGLYRVITPQQDGQSTTAFVHVAAGATISLAGLDAAGTAEVNLQLAGDETSTRLQINLTDVATGTVFTSFPGGEFSLRRRALPRSTSGSAPLPSERVLAVPVGQYQVTLAGDPEVYLRSMTLKGKTISGRIVTLAGGPSSLALNITRGRASVTGHVMLAGKPVEGAMVMLVPSTFGQAGAIDLLRRDQSNADGSYELSDVIPGDYILFALDRGWGVNWHDPATLNHYLLEGTPLSLQPNAKAEQEVKAWSP